MVTRPPWANYGAYIPFDRPVELPPTVDPAALPSKCLTFPAAWEPYVRGALKSLARPETYKVDFAASQDTVSAMAQLQDMISDTCGCGTINWGMTVSVTGGIGHSVIREFGTQDSETFNIVDYGGLLFPTTPLGGTATFHLGGVALAGGSAGGKMPKIQLDQVTVDIIGMVIVTHNCLGVERLLGPADNFNQAAFIDCRSPGLRWLEITTAQPVWFYIRLWDDYLCGSA